MPGILSSVNLSAMTCEVQVAIQAPVNDEDGNTQFVNLPLLLDVPIVFPSGGGFTITFPLKAGDEVLVIFANRAIDTWWQSSGVQKPIEARMNDLSDAFAIPGPKSQPKKISDISGSNLQIRADNNTGYFQIAADGRMNLVVPTADLKGLLTDLDTALATFMTVLAGFGGGGAPVTQAMLQAPAAAAVTSLTAVLAKIGALLV